MSGGGSPAAAPANTTSNSTDTIINQAPAYSQQYISDLLGQAAATAAQPYQQFPGQQVASLTPDQTNSFSQIEDLTGNGTGGAAAAQGTAANNAALGAANTANNISSSGSPYLQAAAMYNPAQAASPYEAASAATNTPQGISSYMSPYLNNEITGLETAAQQNWNQFTAPSVNNSFISAGQAGSGRNAQVIGQQASLADQALTGQIASAENTAYTTAGQQANAAATNLSGLGTLAGTTAAAQASNLQNVGAGLGNLASTQAGAQGTAATNLANTASTVQNNAITGASALSAVGQQQQNQNQSNINTAIQNFNAQNLFPETQESFLNSIINGLPSGGNSQTGSAQSPTTTNQIGSTSPLSTLAGGLIGAAGVTAKKGGLIKGYAEGGQVDDEDNAPGLNAFLSSLLSGSNDNTADASSPPSTSGIQLPSDDQNTVNAATQVAANEIPKSSQQDVSPISAVASDTGISPLSSSQSDDGESTSNSPLQSASQPQDSSRIRNMQLLAMAKGFLTPSHSPGEALGNAFGNLEGVMANTPNYQGQQQDVVSKQLSNASNYAGLARQNVINQSLGFPTIPLPDIPGLSGYGQQIQQSMRQNGSSSGAPAQSAVTTQNGNIRSVDNAPQGQTSSSQPMNIMRALQIANARVPASEQEKYQAVVTLQGAQFPVPPSMAEEVKQYAQDSGKLANAGSLSYATSQGELPAKITAERAGFQNLRGAGDNPSALYDPLSGGFVAEGSQKGIVPAGQPGAGTPYRLPPSVGGQNGVGIAESQANSPQVAPSTTNNGASPPPNGLPPGATQTGLPPQSHELLTEGTKDMIEKQQPIYAAAQQTLMSSQVIDANLDRLGNQGWFAPGTGAATRVEIAKGLNSALATSGLPSSLTINPEKVATAEELNKQTVNLGFNLARTMGARESQQVVEQAIKINPGLGTTYLGGKMVNSLIAENAQRTKDQYEYKMQALNNGIDPLTAETQFNKQYPGTAYVKRAVSQFSPPSVSSPQQADKLLPGTVFMTPNGARKVVPMPQNYQFTMPPTNRQFGGQ